MKILITGGAGFIGSALIRYIIEHTTDSVINVDKLTYAANLESLAAVCSSDRYVFEQADICDPVRMEEVFAAYRPDAVMHLAAESHVDRSISGPMAFLQTNVIGTGILLETVRKYLDEAQFSVRSGFRFLHVSTDEVYGDLGTSLDLFTETTPYAPSSPYAASKAASDHLVRAWSRTYGLPVLITNCSNNYGPCQFPEKLIPLMILNALEGTSLPVYGKGDQIRDWLYVADHARALYLVLTQGHAGATYNIGGHNEMRNIDVVHAVCELLDELRPESPFVPHASLISYVKDRPGHDQRYAIDASRIADELGWMPGESFASGLRKTVNWYLENPGWVDRVKNGAYRRWLELNYDLRGAAQ